MKQKSLGVKARKRIGSVVYHCFMVLLSLTMIYPFVWSVLSSFKTSEQLYGGSPLDLLPKPATLYNYERLFQVLPFGKFVINSFFLAVAMPICMIAVASLTAYALTRLEFKGRNILFLAFVATMMVPSHVTLIPNYKIVVDAHPISAPQPRCASGEHLYRIVPYQYVYRNERIQHLLFPAVFPEHPQGS